MGRYIILIIEHISESCITGPAKSQNIQPDIDMDIIMDISEFHLLILLV